MCWQQLR